jgi:hypothetical protein
MGNNKKTFKGESRMIFVNFVIRDGNTEHPEFSWWKSIIKKDYGKTIDDKFLIHDVYSDDKLTEFSESCYEDSDGRLIHVGSVEDISQKDLNVLIKFGVVPR